MVEIFVQYGDILLNGGADLSILPCSAKHSVHPITQGKIEKFRLAAPNNFRYRMEHGQISKIYKFRGNKRITKYYAFAAAVLNKTSSPEIIYRISKQLALCTNEHDDIRNVEVPMLGTGAGGLVDEDSCVPMARGFRESAHPDSKLFIYVYGTQRVAEIDKMVNSSRFEEIFKRIRIKPSFMGIGLDLDRDKERLLKRFTK